MFFVRSREKYLIFFASFCFFSLQIFRFQPKRNQYTYFRFVSLPKILYFADDFLRFALKRNEINIFWLLLTSLGTDLKIERQTLIFFFVSLQIVRLIAKSMLGVESGLTNFRIGKFPYNASAAEARPVCYRVCARIHVTGAGSQIQCVSGGSQACVLQGLCTDSRYWRRQPDVWQHRTLEAAYMTTRAKRKLWCTGRESWTWVLSPFRKP
jgi:hypothetical protein